MVDFNIDNGLTNKGGGMGAGAGVGIETNGFLVTRDGEISFLSTAKTGGLDAVFDKVPDLIEKFTNNKSKKENPIH